jgi:hypothetical protein
MSAGAVAGFPAMTERAATRDDPGPTSPHGHSGPPLLAARAGLGGQRIHSSRW